MARRSALDLEVGDRIRAHELVDCPQCLVEVIWRSVPELEDHIRQCRIIELGLAVGSLQLDDLIPEVEKKPQGWGWMGR